MFAAVSSMRRGFAAAALLLLAAVGTRAQPVDPLPSWNASAGKARIVAFVQAVTEPGGKDFVAPADRIAVFDNDGTLWSEPPMYFQLAFALDRVRALAPTHPQWKTRQPFKAAIEGDMKTLAAAGERGLLELVAASHGGLTTGSSLALKYEQRNGQPALVQQPKVAFVDDKAGKPVGIHKAIGMRPIAAFGNSDGDFQMLEWTTSAPGARLGVLVHHDDAEREYAYDRESSFGKLDQGLDEAGARGWTLVSMKNDWKQVYAPAR